jgi:hypothetical protein
MIKEVVMDDVQSTESGISIDSIAKYSEIVFRDLDELSRHHPDVFDELYYNREEEFTLLETIVENAFSTAVNILILGDAGIGKSSFIRKLSRKADNLDKGRLYPILVDYRTAMPGTATGCAIQFMRDLSAYFDHIGQPIHTLKDLRDDLITYNMQMCYMHLETIPKEKIVRHLFIILDDFDYAEDDWFILLDYFLPFAASAKASVVFTLRPLLLADVQRYDDKFTHYYVRDSQRIELKSLSIPRVLGIRLALLLKAKNEATLYGRIIQRIRRNSSGLQTVVKKLGLENINQLPAFEYPFTKKHNMFMQRITNGNLREVFDIATDTLIYMYDNKTHTTIRVEDDEERISIGREGDIDLFMGDYENKLSSYRMINLHKKRSIKGNSLLYNVLELVKLRQVVDDTFCEIANEYGHRKNDVKYAIGELADKAQRLISPIRLRPRKQFTFEYDVPEYVITEKGDYYLQICEWDEYKEKCGEPGRSIMKEYKP